jgi:hypothetical protein
MPKRGILTKWKKAHAFILMKTPTVGTTSARGASLRGSSGKLRQIGHLRITLRIKNYDPYTQLLSASDDKITT